MPQTAALKDKFDALRGELRSVLLERDDEIEAALRALVAREHVLLLGAPGEAKSYLFSQMMKRVSGARYFDETLGKFTAPETLFGLISVKAMRDEDELRRNVDGFLPTADVAALEEIFKASEALVNSLLWVALERKYRNGNTVLDLPLSTICFTSNELYESEQSEAFFDRIIIRRWVKALSRDGRRQLISMPEAPVRPVPVLSWADVQQAQREASALDISAEAVDALDEIDGQLGAKGILMSPRRLALAARRVLRATAWLDGSATVEPAHLECLADIAWQKPEQIKDVEAVVFGVASPHVKEAIDVADAIAQIGDDFDAAVALDDSSGRQQAIMEVKKRLNQARTDTDLLAKKVSGRAGRIVADVDAQINTLGERVLTEGFGFSASDLAGLVK